MNIKQLGKLIRKSHQNTKSWNKTGREFGITGGMAFRIVHSEYEPVSQSTRNRLGLDIRICPCCKRKIVHKTNTVKPETSEMEKIWRHLPAEERQRVIKQYITWRKKNGQ